MPPRQLDQLGSVCAPVSGFVSRVEQSAGRHGGRPLPRRLRRWRGGGAGPAGEGISRSAKHLRHRRPHRLSQGGAGGGHGVLGERIPFRVIVIQCLNQPLQGGVNVGAHGCSS